MKQNVNRYSDEFKWIAVQDYINSDLSQEEIRDKYSIRGKACITNWMRKFGLKEPAISRTSTQISMAKGRKKTPEERALEAKVKELEKALEYEKLRSLALDTMIDIAEKNMQIPIRKKPGTKR
jgi:transposase-like protein